MNRVQIWSSGGGVQSTAIAALIVSGKIEKPDLAVIADTGYEQSTTWEYLKNTTVPALKSVGVNLEIVKTADYATVGLWGGADGESLLIPAFTTKGDDIGKMPGYCSGEWKTRVIQRWASEKNSGPFDLWMGISIDELKRATPGAGRWQKKYPLIDRRMNRGDCVALVESLGWPMPPRSSCWMCPNHTQEEWRDIRDNKPKDWEQAVKFDRAIRNRDQHAFVHPDAVPLDEADLDDKNGVLFGHECQSGMCFV